MKVAISLPDALFKAADAVARQQRKSRSQLYAEAIDAYIRARGASAVREQLDAVYARQPSRPDAALESVQFQTADPDETW